MGGVNNGDDVNATVTNAAFMFKNVIETTATTDSATTGSNQDVTLATGLTIFTNVSLVSIRNLVYSSRVAASVIVLKNFTTAAVTIINNSGGTAANRILTGTGANLVIPSGKSISLIYDTANSRWQVIGSAFIAPTTQTFSSGTGTYTTPQGCSAIIVRGVGGGGAGGSCATNTGQAGAGGGGSGGGYFEKLIASPAASYSYGVGAAGAAAASGNNAGGDGGDTTFDTLTGSKGVGGGGSAAVTGPVFATLGTVGGAATGGDINIPGGAGGSGMALTSAGQQLSGAGGTSFWSNGGKSQQGTGAGNAATGYGGGGSGGAQTNNGGAQVGGVGTAGRIVVTEFYN